MSVTVVSRAGGEAASGGAGQAELPVYPMARECPFDPSAELSRLRDEQPVSRVRLWDGSTPWLVTRYEHVRAALADPRLSADSRRPGYPATSLAVRARRADRGRVFIAMDDPDHARYRRMLTGEFTVKRIEGLRPLIEATVDDLLDTMVAHGGPLDLVEAFALPLPSMVICHLLGVPYADHEFFQSASRLLLNVRTGPEPAMAAADELTEYLRSLVERRVHEPTDDLLGRLVARRVSTGELAAADAASTAFLLLVAGHETTANMLGLGTLTLLRHPGQAAEVRDGDPATVAGAVEELLRLLTVVHQGRRRAALADLEIGGVHIKAGDGVIMAGEAANRDPDVYPDPDALDIHRATNHHVAFGFGVHQCLGQPLARLEMQLAFPALLRRFPGLRVTVPVERIRFRDEMVVYGVHELPVAW
jgi:hypothetical protein